MQHQRCGAQAGQVFEFSFFILHYSKEMGARGFVRSFVLKINLNGALSKDQ